MKFDSGWNERLVMLALHETQGIGWRSIDKVHKHASLMDCVHYSDKEWAELGLRGDQVKAVKQGLQLERIQSINERYERLGVQIITALDDHYPPLLRQMFDPPWVIYVLGDERLLHAPSIAMVGTRVPTAYGRQTALKLAEQLSGAGLTVVSGLARGIDRFAHEGALRGIGSTVAVLGTPIDVVYPPDNRTLYRSIAESGLLLSEYPIGMRSHPGLFPQRNRIIAGLSLGTIVVEAALRSGSLITADQALDMSREVYAVPGPISSPKSEGANKLIKQGSAKMVTELKDVLEDFIYRSDLRNALMMAEKPAGKTAADLTDEERRILQLLQDKPGSADELHEQTGIPFGHLHAVLINLTIKHKIEQHPGFIYSVL
ncbi:DNA-processing protein DprA [Paenibacillus abyssi]|uniref:DNA polymerase n=1 Tax=Paenibacillus abyssi TaxID=1340531 RepID=A0A917D6X0_9BACL|nr:DNA-processing protein DprA [Paenibacillus abyssi]GGG12476.1 DNA polymerase [Paenibacillus abyssi]